MKKIVTLIICVALVLAMAVPAFASVYDDLDMAYGYWLFKEDLGPVQNGYSYTVTMTFRMIDPSINLERIYKSILFQEQDGHLIVTYTNQFGYPVVVYNENGWVDQKYRRINITNIDDLSHEDYLTFKTVLADPYCTCGYVDYAGTGWCNDCQKDVHTGGVLLPDTDAGPSVTYETYNGVRLPTISTVWNDTGAYTACIIFKDKASDTYHLIYGSYYDKDYVHYNTAVSGSPQTYCSIHNWTWYDLIDDNWTYQTANTNDVICRVESYDLIWANQTIYTDSTRQTPFFQLPPTVEAPTLAGVITAETLAEVLTEVIAILPTGLVCLVGYLTLRKALKVLQTVLYQA